MIPGLTCAIKVTPSYAYEPDMACFDWFDEAISYASGNTVDASPWRGDGGAAMNDNNFIQAVNGAPGKQRIYGVDFSDVNFQGIALVVWGDGSCDPGSSNERVFKDL